MAAIQSLIPQYASTVLVFFVNGKKVVEPKPDPEWTLLWYLRRKLHLTGTKYGCGEGGCGACTVMVSQYLKARNGVKHIAINACLTPVCAMHGLAVTTVEGIGSTEGRLHPVQERIAKAHGSQCGFCTPGIVMSMYSLLRSKENINYWDIDTALQGNLCRCTGYRPIIEGFQTFLNKGNNPCAMGENCCRNNGNKKNENVLFLKSSFTPYNPTQEPIFPPELKLNKTYSESYLIFRGDNVTWIRPKKISELFKLKSAYPNSKIVVGNTEIGIEMKFKKKIYPILIYPTLIPEMYICIVMEKSIAIGAAITLNEMETFLIRQYEVNKSKGLYIEAIIKMLKLFSGNQIRNVATLVGNILTASPISDLNPILMACSAVLNVGNMHRKRDIVIDSNFFVGYRKTLLSDDEVVVSIEIPFSDDQQFFKAYKQSRRRDDDISIVTAAFNVKFVNRIVADAKLCFGGMGPTTICATQSSQLMKRNYWNKSMLQSVMESLINELQLEFSAPGGMADYRKSLCLSLFFKFFLYVADSTNSLKSNNIENAQLSGMKGLAVSKPKSSQYFNIKKSGNKTSNSVGKPIQHISAFKQATGEAIYCDDIPHIEGELFLTLVLSTESHAKIKSINADKALSIPGVVSFLSAADLDIKSNEIGPIVKDEEVFSRKIVFSRSCVIGAIVAESESAARKAKDLVSVTYDPIQPVLVTIEEAIDHGSFFDGSPSVLKKGNVQNIFMESLHIVEGTVRTGTQEHFYLETISAYAVRREDELEIICTTQSPCDIAKVVSQALNIPSNKVVCKVKRVGGGFGGKETKTSVLAVPVAIAAYKLKKPIRAVLDRNEDMQISGYRHPFLIKYKVAFDKFGKILGVVYRLYCNAGFSLDISDSMMGRAIMHVDNSYFIPNIEVSAYICKTNLPSNTAFRGFGAPQVMLATEIMMRDIAAALNKTYEEIALVNMYVEGSFTHYNQILQNCTLPVCWFECVSNCKYWERKKKVEEFNRLNRWKKKGIALVPTKYGISFQSDVLMQAGALLMVYTDGSVLLSIGGVEMGQGLYTKMIQIVSRALGVNIDKVHISEMSTDKVPNSSPTAASISSDLYGMAVFNACNILNERLTPYKSLNWEGSWEEWIAAAYLDRVNLCATGFYAAPKIEYDKEINIGKLYEYFTYGVACSEVIIDCLTGEHQVIRTDIVMDIGESINPAIDIGQIEGAFMQGYGFFTMEEMLFSPEGEVLSVGPGTYKIPAFSDIPKEFNVSLLKSGTNPRAVYSSKAVGEPPLFLAASVFFAIKEAIKDARVDMGISPLFVLDAPATCARIRMACEDNITELVVERAMFHFSNAYYIPNVEVVGHVCKTNLPSNTAFRGFGGPQGMFGAENMIRDVAYKLGKNVEDLSRLNLYEENSCTHYGQILTHCTLQRCWDECIQKSELAVRRISIDKFNKQYRWRKRGISVVPTMFGIAFPEKFLNQAGALVIIYVDGSVLLSHGGTEMGQGLNTKMIQVASRTLGIDISKIHISDTSTNKVPNTSPTAASFSSDLNGMAVLEACKTLVKRLQPYKEKNPDGTWEQWVLTAYVDRVSLSATGFHATPDLEYDWTTNSGRAFNYFTFGVACSEVEIDCLSGDHQVLRTDIVMDLGDSLNPAIDIGQVEGAFIQGYGLFTLEELIYSPTGTLYSRGPGAYKIPGFGDIPQEFNVSLLKGAPNPRAVYSSKAVGEPPLFLASTVYFAIKEAIRAARADAGVPLDFHFESPATSARIRMACEDHISMKLVQPEPGSFVPWNIVL
ncbi:xanthine dehydrogenase-like [Aphomia sociella]